MPMFDRSEPETLRVIDRWADGVGWIAHPDEGGQRASHAVLDGEDGVWLFDPLDAPSLDDLLVDFAGGEVGGARGANRSGAADAVAGVVVCSAYHARDAGRLADRYDVSVHVPPWTDRGASRVAGPVERIDGGVAGFSLTRLRPLYAWNEAIAYRERDGTLYVPDFLSSLDRFTVGGERIALPTPSRLRPPRAPFAGLAPERILFGHGEGIFEDAAGALADSFDGARARLPRALVSNLPAEIRSVVGALR